MADHLFGKSRLPQEHLNIEYNGPPYDGGPWQSYPSRQGWKPESDTPELEDIFIHPEQRPNLECWLYFGVLHAVLGQVSHDDFLRIENGRQYLTSASLLGYVDRALAATGKRKDGGKIIFGQCSLAEFRAVETRMGSVLSSDGAHKALRPEMLFAIRVLHASLTHAVDKQLGKETLQVSIPPASTSRDEWADKQLRAKGWCPSEISCFTNFGSVLSQAYALQLRRPVKTSSAAEGGHARCTAGECAENLIDDTKPYETKHYPPHCRCEHVRVPVDKVQAILRNGGIPLVRVMGPADGPAKVEVLEHRPGRNYVALSHVWSDGLGNKDVNSLPSCQLHRLKEKAVELLWDSAHVPGAWDNPVSALHVSGRHMLHAAMSLTHSAKDDTLIWVDTLCVPLEDETRKLAIRGMKKTYEKAHRVMVLDSELANSPSKGAPKEEILLRILTCSGWMRRLWTLQEGLAARRSLYVLFQDQFINIPDMADKLWLKHYHGKFHVLQESVAYDAFGLWFQWFRTLTSSHSTFDRFLDVAVPMGKSNRIVAEPWELVAYSWSNVSARATSKDEDRPVILANIADMDLKDILDIKKDAPRRMRAIYKMLSKFAQEVVFLPGKRFQGYGWRWALECCFNQENRPMGRSLGTPARIVDEGLLTQLVGLRVGLGRLVQTNREEFWLQTIRTFSEGGQRKEQPRSVKVAPKEEQPWETRALHEVGIIFEDSFKAVSHHLFGEGEGRLTCVVVSVVRECQGIVFGRYEFLAEATSLKRHSSLPRHLWAGKEPRLGFKSLLEKQRWCIG